MAQVLPEESLRDRAASPGRAHKYSTPLPFLGDNRDHQYQSQTPNRAPQVSDARQDLGPGFPSSSASIPASTSINTTGAPIDKQITAKHLSTIQEASPYASRDSVDSFILNVDPLPPKPDVHASMPSVPPRTTSTHQGSSSFSSDSSAQTRHSNGLSLTDSSDSRVDSVMQPSPTKPYGVPANYSPQQGRSSLSSDSTGNSGKPRSTSDSSSIYNPAATQKYTSVKPGILRNNTGLTSSDESGHSRTNTGLTGSDSSDSQSRARKITRFHEPPSDDDASITTVYPRFSIGDVPDDYRPYASSGDSIGDGFDSGNNFDAAEPPVVGSTASNKHLSVQNEESDRFSIGDVPDDFRPFNNGHNGSNVGGRDFAVGSTASNKHLSLKNEETDRFSIGDVPDDFRPFSNGGNVGGRDLAVGSIASNKHLSLKNEEADRFSIGDVPDDFRPYTNGGIVGGRDFAGAAEPSATGMTTSNGHHEANMEDHDTVQPSAVRNHRVDDNSPENKRVHSNGTDPAVPPEIATSRVKPGHIDQMKDSEVVRNIQTLRIDDHDPSHEPPRNSGESYPFDGAEPPVIQPVKPEAPSLTIGSKLKQAFHSIASSANPLSSDMDKSIRNHRSEPSHTLLSKATPGGPDPLASKTDPQTSPMLNRIPAQRAQQPSSHREVRSSMPGSFSPSNYYGASPPRHEESMPARVSSPFSHRPSSPPTQTTAHFQSQPQSPSAPQIPTRSPHRPTTPTQQLHTHNPNMPNHPDVPDIPDSARPPHASSHQTLQPSTNQGLDNHNARARPQSWNLPTTLQNQYSRPRPTTPPQTSTSPRHSQHQSSSSYQNFSHPRSTIPKTPDGSTRQVVQDGVPTKQKKVEGVFFEQVEGVTMRTSKHDHENEENELEIPEMEAQEVREIPLGPRDRM